MLTVGFDTSGVTGSVAVVRSGAVIATREHGVSNAHGESLLALVDATLAEARVTRAEVDRWAVGLGPGSFTGVRVAVATAAGIALASGVEVCGVPSLEALAWVAAQLEAGPVVALADALRGELFVHAPGSEAVDLVPTAALASWLEGRVGGAALLVGATALLPTSFWDETDHRAAQASGLDGARGVHVALASEARAATRLDALEPLYARAPAISVAKPRAPRASQR